MTFENKLEEPAVPTQTNIDAAFTRRFDHVQTIELVDVAARRDYWNAGRGAALRQQADTALAEIVANPQQNTKGYYSNKMFDTIGLALSGGGIRSAAFCTGVLQALSIKKILPRIDYLSTVSGGGYAGIAATLAMNASKGAYPFASHNEVKDTADMRALRNNANYLRFGKLGAVLKNLSLVAKGFAINMLFVISVLLALAAFTLWANPDIHSLSIAGFYVFSRPSFISDGFIESAFGITAMVGIAVFIGLVLWAVWLGCTGKFETLRGFLLKAAMVFIVATGISAFFEAQPQIVRWMVPDKLLIDAELSVAAPHCTIGEIVIMAPKQPVSGLKAECIVVELVAKKILGRVGLELPKESKPERTGFKKLVDNLQVLFAPALALIALASRMLGDVFKVNESETGWTATIKKLTGRAVVWAAALALPLLLWAGYLGLVYWGLLAKASAAVLEAPFAPTRLTDAALAPFFGAANWGAFAALYATLATVGLLIFFLSMLAPNANSLHGLYRARLGRAFCLPWSTQRELARDKGEFPKLSVLDPLLSPYLIVNAALNVHSSKVVNASGRNADFFTFTRRFVGSEATGYADTATYEKAESQLDIATAMAVSGAAVSSNMGTQSIKPLALTLSLLNVRLGAWLFNPRIVSPEIPTANPFYFIAEILGWLDEKKKNIYLTDGGHIENLGAYELIKRRCKLIIVVDAEADRDMNFGSLITLQRYARIDLGAKIDIKWSDIARTSLFAQKGGAPIKNGPHCAIGKIEYENGGEGILIYIKSSVTGDENDYVTDYNRRNRDYPHETTGDQFFSEEQFEVYRALGFHAAHGLFAGKHNVQTSNAKLERFSRTKARGFGVKAAYDLLLPKSAPKAKPPAPRKLKSRNRQ